MYRILSISVSLLLFFVTAFAQSDGKPARLSQTEVEKWRQDLRYMADEMPKRHKNLFHTMTREEFTSAVRDLDRRIPNLSRDEVIVGITRIVAMVHDGHTGVRGLLYGAQIGFHYYPLGLYLFQDGLFVYAADPQYAGVVGGRVIKIGNHTTEQAIAELKSLVFRDNEMTIKERVPLLLTTPEILHAVGIIENIDTASFVVKQRDKQVRVEVKPVKGPRPSNDNWALGQRFSRLPGWIDVRDTAPVATPLWLKQPENYFWFQYLEDSRTIYVQYNDVANKADETVADFAKRLFAFVDAHPVDRFVIDLRWNTGGNNYLNKPLLLGIIKSPKVDQRGKLFAIIGRRTFSAAQNFVNDLQNYTNVLFVGEPTASNPNFYGDATTIVLPNSAINVGVSTLWWQDLDPRITRPWTGPEIAVELASEDYKSNNDPAMKLILNYVPKPEITESLMQALSADQLADAIKLYRNFKTDPINAYVDTEARMNNLGYRLIRMKRLDQAIEIFRLNVGSYPQSANAYDSLAEAYMLNGNKELAIKNYGISLRLNPRNSSAAETLRKLKAK
jgi:tetratricopeptide (TPR) repeat protein